MSYKLRFHELALKEWRKLDPSLREQFKQKLAERLVQPLLKPGNLMNGCMSAQFTISRLAVSVFLRIGSAEADAEAQGICHFDYSGKTGIAAG